jgi:hypothetical protein
MAEQTNVSRPSERSRALNARDQGEISYAPSENIATIQTMPEAKWEAAIEIQRDVGFGFCNIRFGI